MSLVPALVTLADVKAHLNLPPTDTSQDVELGGFIDAASEFVVYATGPISPTTFTETHDVSRGQDSVLLRQPPVLTVTTVLEVTGPAARALTEQPPGATVDGYGFSVDLPASGKLTRRSAAGTPMSFLGATVIVTYTAGRAAVPAQVRMATLEDLRGLYQFTQQGGRPNFDGSGDEGWTAGPMRLFPRLAALLDGIARVPGIA